MLKLTINLIIKSMKLLNFIIALLLIHTATSTSAQEWKDWESHDIKAFYVEIDEDEAEYHYDAEEFGNKWFIHTRIPNGTYSIEIGDKIESKFYRINGTKYYALFVFTPFLWKWDEGILEVFGRGGTFYKKED